MKRHLCIFLALAVGAACSDDVPGAGGPGGNGNGNGNGATDSGINPNLPEPECRVAAQCDDGVACTRDICATDGTCRHTPDDSACAANELCHETDDCVTRAACTSPNDPACDDGQACTTDTCNMATGLCEYTTDDAVCDDGLFCNGLETCVAMTGCRAGEALGCDDSIPCTVDSCDESTDSCTAVPDNSRCSDNRFCNGEEVCDVNTGCMAGPRPDCTDSDACTQDFCDPAVEACVHPLKDQDMDGDPDFLCGGGDCRDDNPAIRSTAIEVCDGIDNNCDGFVDEGVTSECGDCDPTCRNETATGTTTQTSTTSPFDPNGMFGTFFDEGLGGLTVSMVSESSNDLWVPNTAESTLSRWDAATGMEVGRYRVGLPSGECPNSCCWAGGCNQPSRVVVDGVGDAYIANRGFQMQGTVSKIASHHSRCVDRNGNGQIDTSSTSTALPWDEDECVLWTVPVGPANAVLRAIAIDRGDEFSPAGYAWVGGYNTRRFWKLDPRTGAVLQQVDVPVRPYGAVVVADGRLWVGTLDEDGTAWVDTSTTGSVVSPRITFPNNLRGSCRRAYGITADATGRIWFAGWSCNDAMAYDPVSGMWSRIDLRPYGSTVGRGITVDPDGIAWTAVGGGGRTTVLSWDTAAFAPGQNMNTPVTVTPLPSGHNGPSGIGADGDGRIWIGHYQTSQLVRLDKNTGQMQSFTGANRIYTYSDFTGAVRRAVIGRGFYTKDHDAGCANAVWERLEWDVNIPPGGFVRMSVRTSSTATTSAALDSVTPLIVATLPSPLTSVDLMADLAGALIVPGPLIRITIELENAQTGMAPVLRSYTLRWHCN